MGEMILEIREEHVMAYRLHRAGHTDTEGAAVMSVTRETFNRHKNHALRVAKFLIGYRAQDKHRDPIEALDDVHRVICVSKRQRAPEPRQTTPPVPALAL